MKMTIEEPPVKKNEKPDRKELTPRVGFFLAALLLHLVVLLMIATIVVFRPLTPARDETFVVSQVAPPPTPPTPPPPATTSDASSNVEPDLNVTPPPALNAPIVSQAANAFSFAAVKTQMPGVPSIVKPVGSGTLAAAGGGPGTGPAGPAGFFGGGGTTPGLAGNLYDLKQTPSRQPTKMAASGEELNTNTAIKDWNKLPASIAYLEVLKDFCSNWNVSRLEQYYKAPKQLNAQQLFIPKISAALAPEAFGAADTVNPRRWVAYYHGKILAPKTGQYRFVGIGDDILMVRINGRTILDGGLVTLDRSANDPDRPDVGAGVNDKQPLKAGKFVTLSSDTAATIEILIGEFPGGQSFYFLLVQEKSDKSAPGDYPAFQVVNTEIPESDKRPPGFTGKKLVFSLAP